MSVVHSDLEALKHYRRLLRTWAQRTEARVNVVEVRCNRLRDKLDWAEERSRTAISQLEGELYECYRLAAQGHAVNCERIRYELYREEQYLARLLQARERLETSCRRYAEARRRVDTLLTSDVSAALAYLDKRIASLEAYFAAALLTGAAAAGAGVAGLMGVVAAGVRKSSGDLNRALGRSGEEVAALVLSQRFGLEEVAFDQPAHGFDRVFRAPGIPVVVMESKVRRDGKLHLGQTQYGRQGSTSWVDATSAAMANPGSEQHSPTNARIGAAVRAMGAENVPVVTVVTDPDHLTADVYVRQGSDTWELVEQDIDLKAMTDAAGEAAASSADSLQNLYHRPEFREGNFGGPERKG